ncbi:tRNA pseudouridine synthase D, partial [Spraguea lophii 42_110]
NIKDKYDDFIVKEIHTDTICDEYNIIDNNIIREIINIFNTYGNNSDIKCVNDRCDKDINRDSDNRIYNNNNDKDIIIPANTVIPTTTNIAISTDTIIDLLNNISFPFTLYAKDRNDRIYIHNYIKYIPQLKAYNSDGNIILEENNNRSIFECTLKKIGCDTMEAINKIAYKLNINSKDIQFAGNKDKRAITYQRITINNVYYNDIKNYNNNNMRDNDGSNDGGKRDRDDGNGNKRDNDNVDDNNINNHNNENNNTDNNINNSNNNKPLSISTFKNNNNYLKETLYNIKACNRSIGLGSLIGNRFIIRISKDISYLPINEILCFIPNFYGPQRFGINIDNHIVGKLILEKKYYEALELIMQKKENDNPTMIIGKEKYKNKEYKEYLKYFKRGVEKHICVGRIHNCKDKNIYYSIRKEVRSIYVHAYQSYHFNMEVSDRIKKGYTVLDSDMVLIDKQSYNKHNDENNLERGNTNDNTDSLEHDGNNNDITNDDNNNDNINNTTNDNMNMNIKSNKKKKEIAVYYRDVKDKTNISIYDVVLPLKKINNKTHYRKIIVKAENIWYKDKVIGFDLQASSYATIALSKIYSHIK